MASFKKEFKEFVLRGNVMDMAVGEFNEFGEEIVSATTLNYGLFIQNVVDFFIIALVIFIMIRAINSLRRKHEEPAAPAPEPSDEVKLLTEIRNLLDKKQ